MATTTMFQSTEMKDIFWFIIALGSGISILGFPLYWVLYLIPTIYKP